MVSAIIEMNAPMYFNREIICLADAINKNDKSVSYWKKCVSKNIDEALKLEMITEDKANSLRQYYDLEEAYVN